MCMIWNISKVVIYKFDALKYLLKMIQAFMELNLKLDVKFCLAISSYFTIVTGAFALCKTKFDVLPKNNSFGNPIPLDPITI